jgi:hypothetical protein
MPPAIFASPRPAPPRRGLRLRGGHLFLRGLGEPVYLARSQWWLGRAQRDYPKIVFHTSKERH